jgi:hypothetical protein
MREVDVGFDIALSQRYCRRRRCSSPNLGMSSIASPTRSAWTYLPTRDRQGWVDPTGNA